MLFLLRFFCVIKNRVQFLWVLIERINRTITFRQEFLAKKIWTDSIKKTDLCFLTDILHQILHCCPAFLFQKYFSIRD